MFHLSVDETSEAHWPTGALSAADPDEPAVSVAELAERLPGADLAWLLEIADLGAIDDHGLVEVVAAWQRVASWAAAGAARAAAALAARPSMNPRWPDAAGRVTEPNVAGEELAMRLGCSRRQARALVRHGRAFEGALAWTGDALARGEIDATKAHLVADALEDVPVPVALAVQDLVLDGAARRTPTQLARDVARALVEIDPDAAAERYAAARRGRRVDAPRVLPNGMAGIWAVLPATSAVRLDSALGSLARSARTAGDPRTLDQLRADLLVDLTVGAVEGSVAAVALAALGSAETETHRQGARKPVPSTEGDEPLEAVETHEPLEARESTTSADRDEPNPRRPAPRTEVRVTVALSTLLGLDDAPADLAGYGPVTAEAARALARGGTWRRIVTDPLSGAVLDVGRTRYRPPVDLDEHVRVRDRTCARPGCAAAADSCDLDHTEEYHRAHGTTSDGNLAPLCRRDHVVKTDGGFRLVQIAPGVVEWTTPTGHRYRVSPGLDRPYEVLPRVPGPGF
ncbi:HNH endonuclease signature motif containing protein [Actinotalea fermentans]|uniref:Uncharacterized protein n=1 Tax=Actinotalea fermentans TaxID=43671 RepID=A0A511YWF3_9CELL|nr:HNH endonuclease signature motif containing protein [Actinotalea fermentans]GEN79456.1 hypothetical protein AFE02nite_11900 [Actinotalea fermentans]